MKEPNVAMVMELMKGGTLASLLHSDIKLTWGEKLLMLEEIAIGIKVLHSNQPMVCIFSLKS